MKKSIYLVIFLTLAFFMYICIINKAKNYKLTYEINSYKVKEEYNKEKKAYYINVYNDDTNYSFYMNKKYSSKRKLINDIEVTVNGDETCIKPLVNGYKFEYVCNNKNVYSIKNYKEEITSSLIKKSDSIEIYNDNYIYYVWNGYGITNVKENKDIKFLKKEHYENLLSFKTDNNIIFADYDSERTFNKFYIFNRNDEKVEKIETEFDISFDSYFLGSVKNRVYLFDKKNNKEYEINLKKKKVIDITNKELGKYYDNGFKEIELSKFKYNDLYFKYNNLVNYEINDEKLYKYYETTKNKILLTDKSVKNIVTYNDNSIFYISDDSLYLNDSVNNILLLKNFEWKFNYLNQIFIF